MDGPGVENGTFTRILADPQRARAELSLYEFEKQAWHVLHPSTPFVEGWAVGATCEHLQAVTDGQIDRLVINVPPGCTKSMTANVMWPSWEWGPRGMPHNQFINASYDKRLSVRDMMHTRDLVSSEWYQHRWPITFKDDDRGKEKFSNTQQGFRYAASVGSGLTGWRGQRFIIDDPHSVQMAESDAERAEAAFWFLEVTPTRFTDPKRPVYVIIMQRLHEDDISGIVLNHLLEQGWVHLCLPMRFEPKYRSYSQVEPMHHEAKAERRRRVKDEGDPVPYWVDDPQGERVYAQDPRTKQGELLWPERYDEPSVKALETQLTTKGGNYAVACQLDQRPVPREGGLFKPGRITLVDAPIEGVVIRGWDLAATKKKRSPYTVGAKLILGYDGRLCIADMRRFREETDEVRALIAATVQADGYETVQSIPQDPGQAGKAQVLQFARDLHGYDVRFSPESGDKETRAEPFATQVNAGNVCMVRAPWNDVLLAELGLFPGSTYKDQVDALSRAYHEHLKDVDDDSSVLGGSQLIS